MAQRITGLHAVTSLLRNNPQTVSNIYVDRARKDARMRDVRALAQQAGVRVQRVTRQDLEALFGGSVHQSVLAELTDTPSPKSREPLQIEDLTPKNSPLLLVLDGVQDPHNLGACLRSADAAGVAALIVPKDGACPMTDAVRRTAAGAAETMPMLTVTNLARCLQTLQQQGYWVYGTDSYSDVTYDHVEFGPGVVIVSGAEGTGLRRLTRQHCDQMISIPLTGSVQSLNVSVASAIILFEVRRQWRTS